MPLPAWARGAGGGAAHPPGRVEWAGRSAAQAEASVCAGQCGPFWAWPTSRPAPPGRPKWGVSWRRRAGGCRVGGVASGRVALGTGGGPGRAGPGAATHRLPLPLDTPPHLFSLSSPNHAHEGASSSGPPPPTHWFASGWHTAQACGGHGCRPAWGWSGRCWMRGSTLGRGEGFRAREGVQRPTRFRRWPCATFPSPHPPGRHGQGGLPQGPDRCAILGSCRRGLGDHQPPAAEPRRKAVHRSPRPGAVAAGFTLDGQPLAGGVCGGREAACPGGGPGICPGRDDARRARSGGGGALPRGLAGRRQRVVRSLFLCPSRHSGVRPHLPPGRRLAAPVSARFGGRGGTRGGRGVRRGGVMCGRPPSDLLRDYWDASNTGAGFGGAGARAGVTARARSGTCSARRSVGPPRARAGSFFWVWPFLPLLPPSFLTPRQRAGHRAAGRRSAWLSSQHPGRGIRPPGRRRAGRSRP